MAEVTAARTAYRSIDTAISHYADCILMAKRTVAVMVERGQNLRIPPSHKTNLTSSLIIWVVATQTYYLYRSNSLHFFEQTQFLLPMLNVRNLVEINIALA